MTEIEFRQDDPSAVLHAMAAIAARGSGWVNVVPVVPEGEAPPPATGLSSMFGSPTFEVPVGTWVPGRRGGAGSTSEGSGGERGADTVGIQHATGPRVVARLASAGVALPEQWRWRQDHPRRGLVVSVPPGSDLALVLDWMLRAATALSLPGLTGSWRAAVFEPDPAAAPT